MEKIFGEDNKSDFVNGVKSVLQIRDYPKDTQFKERLVDTKLYGARERATKAKLILETLEMSYQHKEQVPFTDLSIEHILPQKPTDWWKQHLGKKWQEEHELYLHTLGNLTLTAYNSELSNNPFPEKQKRLISSHLQLNHYFKNVSDWKKKEIEQRADVLANQALKIWPYFGENQFESINEDTVKGKKPKTVIILGQQINVMSWRDVLKETMNTIAELDPNSFEEIVKLYPSFISADSSRFRRNYQLSNGYYVDIKRPAKNIYRFCNQAIESIGLSTEEWKVITK